MGTPALQPTPAAMQAIAELYHRYLTGIILHLVVDKGEAEAAETVFRLFRRQHLDKFLPGLDKLGLTGQPDAVACAKYHYLSNHLGGVGVVYVAESDRKAWVRYVPPRWIFDGTALAAIPTSVARAMLRGWHGHNGVSLNNPRLGFVCTGQTMDGSPGLEGYYVEEDAPLAEDDRVRFRFGEQCPDPDLDALPALGADEWPEERLSKVTRNYAMDYVRNIIPVLVEQYGPLDAQAILYRTGRRIGMQYSAAVMSLLADEGAAGSKTAGDSTSTAEQFAALLRGHGDVVAPVVANGSDASATVVQHSWRLMRGLEADCVPEWFDGWRGLWEGVLAVADPAVRLDVTRQLDLGDDATEWRLSERRPPSEF